MTLHFTDRKTGAVFGYESEKEAGEFHENYKDLHLMTDSMLEEYKNPPLGGKWTHKGWVIDLDLLSREESELKAQDIEKKRQKYFEMEAVIQRLERIRGRNEAEQAELEALINESTALFREIRAEKAE